MITLERILTIDRPSQRTLLAHYRAVYFVLHIAESFLSLYFPISATAKLLVQRGYNY